MIDRISPTIRPSGPRAGAQRWLKLLFLHWELPADAIQARLPRGLTLDTYDGKAYVGLVAFTMRDVSLAPFPAMPGARHFHELNLRTYVHCEGRDPGVWFFSLDAASSLAVVAARATYHLPYHRASMQLETVGDRVHYRSSRHWPRPVPAEFCAHYRIGRPLNSIERTTEPGTLRHFLAERYILYAATGRGRLATGQVHHTPYPLREAHVDSVQQNIIEAAGLPTPVGAPQAMYSEGVDVEVFGLKKKDYGPAEPDSSPQ